MYAWKEYFFDIISRNVYIHRHSYFSLSRQPKALKGWKINLKSAANSFYLGCKLPVSPEEFSVLEYDQCARANMLVQLPEISWKNTVASDQTWRNCKQQQQSPIYPPSFLSQANVFSLTHSLTHSLAQSLARSLARSLTHSLSNSDQLR